jgi:ribosomal protein S18 acetylase RimI-like enzyme
MVHERIADIADLECLCGLDPVPRTDLAQANVVIVLIKYDLEGRRPPRKTARDLGLEGEKDLKVALTAVLTPGELHILSLAVAPNARRHGLAREAISIALTNFPARVVTMECRRDNLAVQRLAESFGGNRIGIRKRYFPDGEDAVVYGMSLERKESDNGMWRTEAQGKEQGQGQVERHATVGQNC